MKTTRFLMMFVAAAAMMFVSCDKDDNNDNGGSGSGGTQTVTAFFPTGYNRANVAAWYTANERQNDGQLNVQAIYVFNDGAMLSTLYKKKANGTEVREIEATGTCNLTSGNWDNGTAVVSIPSLSMEMNITISNGTFTARELTFTRQDNAAIPAPQEATDNGGGQGGGDGNLLTEAYLPISYADKTIESWYAYSNQENDRIKTEAIFLFTDNTMLVTKSKVYTSGREPSYEIEVEGTYQLTNGDYENGTISVVAGGMNITAEISNGVLSAMGGQYTKQPNEEAPEPRE